MLIDVVEYIPPNGAQELRQAEVSDEFNPLIQNLLRLGFSFAYESRPGPMEVLFLTHNEVEQDYRTLILKPEHKNAAGATAALLRDVTLEDAESWLQEQREEA